MPLYEYRCPGGHEFEGFWPMAESGVARPCPLCGKEGGRILSPTRVFGDYEGYESPASGKWIEGRKARIEDLRRTGCRPYEIGEMQEERRRRESAQRVLDQKIDEAVERTAASLGVRP